MCVCVHMRERERERRQTDRQTEAETQRLTDRERETGKNCVLPIKACIIVCMKATYNSPSFLFHVVLYDLCVSMLGLRYQD